MTIKNSTTTRTVAQLLIATTAVMVLGSSVASAWHPVGVIQKDVENLTTGSGSSKADSAATAVAAKPGDTLVYHITVANNGNSDSRGWNDMVKTMVADQLPAGVQLVNKGNFDLGRIKPGQKKTIDITVKVTANTATTIKNQACFTGDSEVNDAPQKGCDLAYVKVTVPAPSPTPAPTPGTTPSPATLGTSTVAPTLPETGAPVLATTLGLSAMIGTGIAYLKSRKLK